MAIISKPYSKWSANDKKTFANEVLTYAKDAGIPLKKRKKVKNK